MNCAQSDWPTSEKVYDPMSVSCLRITSRLTSIFYPGVAAGDLALDYLRLAES